MATQTSVSIQKQDPAIEAYRLGLLKDVQGFIKDRIEKGTLPPDYQVAGLTDSEKAAIKSAQAGVGAYQPFLTGGSSAITTGVGALTGQALPTIQQGIASLQGAATAFDPQAVSSYMNPYEDAAVQQAMQDINRAGLMQQNQAAARAVGAGAFGGSREGLVRAELDRNILEQQGRTAAQMRAAGFQQAQQAAMSGFEQARQRQLQGAQMFGQLGQGIASLGTNLGQLGVQQAGLGEIQSGLQGSDISRLMSVGGLQRGVEQAGLDAQRMTNLQRYTQPYQQYGFLSDIYSGVPTGSSTLTASSAPQVSPFQTALGLGIQGLAAAGGASKAGLF
jgi:hypothetical protein